MFYGLDDALRQFSNYILRCNGERFASGVFVLALTISMEQTMGAVNIYCGLQNEKVWLKEAHTNIGCFPCNFEVHHKQIKGVIKRNAD